MKKIVLSLILSLTLVLTLAAGVAAHSADPSNPESLVLGTAVFDDLVGERAGSYAYFRVTSAPGQWVSVHTYFSPSDGAAMSGVGVNFYGPDGQLLGAAAPTERDGEVDWSFRSPTSIAVLVQIYNYIPGFRSSFGIVAEDGDTAGEARYNLQGQVWPNNDPSRARALALGSVIHSRLTASKATAFAYYAVQYPGNNQPLTVQVSFSPDDALTMRGVAVHIHEIGQVDREPLGVATAAAAAHLVAQPTTITTVAAGRTPGRLLYTGQPGTNARTLLIEVSNALLGSTVQYHVYATTGEIGAEISPATLVEPIKPGELAGVDSGVTTGASQPSTGTAPGDVSAETVVGTTPAAHGPGYSEAEQSSSPVLPVRLVPNGNRMDGLLRGNRAGELAFYAIDYAGDGSLVTIHLLVQPANLTNDGGVGFNLYSWDGTLEARGSADEAGHVHLQASSGAAGRWLIQVYNYLPGTIAGFQVFATR